MGLIRGGLLVIACVLLFVSLLAGNIFLTLTFSLNHENIKNEFSSSIKDLAINGEDLNQLVEKNLFLMEVVCQNNSEFVFENGDYDLSIPCEIVPQGSEAIIDYSAKNFVEEFYYKEYNCGFWNCLKET